MSSAIKFIGIAGGTGAGKSTVCTALLDKYPDKVGLIQLDDYFKPEDEAPKMHGVVNYDHPHSLYLDKLVHDLTELSQGKTVVINTKNERLNPDYKRTEKRIPVEFQPKPIMLVEGYLVLHNPLVRKLLANSIWLEVDHDTRWERRVHFKYNEYEKKVLIPMYKKFAEPTKRYADHIFDVTGLTKEQVFEKVEAIVFNKKSSNEKI